MCSGILFVGVSVALLHGDLQYSVPPSVVMGGGIWALSNFAPCRQEQGELDVSL